MPTDIFTDSTAATPISVADTSTVTWNSSSYAAYLLAEFRLAAIRARLIENTIVTACTALKAGLIDANGAMELVNETPGAISLIAPTSTWAVTGCST